MKAHAGQQKMRGKYMERCGASAGHPNVSKSQRLALHKANIRSTVQLLVSFIHQFSSAAALSFYFLQHSSFNHSSLYYFLYTVSFIRLLFSLSLSPCFSVCMSVSSILPFPLFMKDVYSHLYSALFHQHSRLTRSALQVGSLYIHRLSFFSLLPCWFAIHYSRSNKFRSTEIDRVIATRRMQAHCQTEALVRVKPRSRGRGSFFYQA